MSCSDHFITIFSFESRAYRTFVCPLCRGAMARSHSSKPWFPLYFLAAFLTILLTWVERSPVAPQSSVAAQQKPAGASLAVTPAQRMAAQRSAFFRAVLSGD